MSSNILYELIQFAKKEFVGKTLLLAFSGGVDSTALFYLLVECQKKVSFSFHAAHVNHGWRKESEEEEKKIRLLMEEKKIPLYLNKMVPDASNNMEDRARSNRYLFFQKLIKEKNFEGLIVAHQKEDLAETVLKRVLEGASLTSLYGMHEKQSLYQTTLYRPLINVQKKDLYQYLQKRQLSFFEDYTNTDPHFLRARMRNSIFPFLEKHFQKSICNPLCQISSYSYSLKEYFTKKLSSFLSSSITSPWGEVFSFSGKDLEPLEIEFIIQSILFKHGCSLSRQELNHTINWVLANKTNRQLKKGEVIIYIDRGSVVFSRKALDTISSPMPLKIGVNHQDRLTVCLHKKSLSLQSECNWLTGEYSMELPIGNYSLYNLNNLPQEFPKSTFIRKKLTKLKIPSFLRNTFPIPIKDGRVFFPGETVKDEEKLIINVKVL